MQKYAQRVVIYFVYIHKMRNYVNRFVDIVTHLGYNITQIYNVLGRLIMFDERLKLLRQSKGINMKKAAEQLGMPYTTYVGYEKNEREPNSETLLQIAKFYDCSVDYLIGRTNLIQPEVDKSPSDKYSAYGAMPIKKQKIRLLGEIACGEPIFCDEDREGYIEADSDIRADFCLRAKGDSMIGARIMDGDIVFIREQPMVDDGEIAAVVVDDEATLKRVYYYRDENKLVLQAENPRYRPLVYVNEELDTIRILGKAVAFESKL